jgi:putative transcriptional regulator
MVIAIAGHVVAALVAPKRRYSPSLESAFRIAREFGVGIEEVFAWDAGRHER